MIPGGFYLSAGNKNYLSATIKSVETAETNEEVITRFAVSAYTPEVKLVSLSSPDVDVNFSCSLCEIESATGNLLDNCSNEYPDAADILSTALSLTNMTLQTVTKRNVSILSFFTMILITSLQICTETSVTTQEAKKKLYQNIEIAYCCPTFEMPHPTSTLFSSIFGNRTDFFDRKAVTSSVVKVQLKREPLLLWMKARTLHGNQMNVRGGHPFPEFAFCFEGLEDKKKYIISLRFCLVNDTVYTKYNGEMVPKTTNKKPNSKTDAKATRVIHHRDGPVYGCDLMKKGCDFQWLRMSNGQDHGDYVALSSNRRYTTRIEIADDLGRIVHEQTLEICEFTTVSGYSSPKFSALSNTHNKYRNFVKSKGQ